MRYISEFRSTTRVDHLMAQIKAEIRPEQSYRLMEFCGGHTHAFFRFGLIDLLPKQIKLLHGPGCPVCVLPISRIDSAIQIAQQKDVVLCSYSDMLRVPGSNHESLLKAKSKGADVRSVYSPSDVLRIAQNHPDKIIVFFAVGFETTTPPTADLLEQCVRQNISNIKVFCNHLLTPPAVKAVLDSAGQESNASINGLIGPGHVSLITGSDPYEPLSQQYQLPISISGFEPTDLLQSILFLIKSINAEEPKCHNQYLRAVGNEGNQKAQKLMHKYFELRPSFEWRGLGMQPHSALKIRHEFRHLDAEELFPKNVSEPKIYKACECPAVLTGKKTPLDCPLFNKPCTPENPLGSCMVSSEGACAAYYHYHRHASQ